MAPVVHDPKPEPFDVIVDGESVRFAGQDCPLAHLSAGLANRFWSLTRRFGWWGLPYLESLLRLADQFESANPNPKDLP
jgi:CRISPR-associated endonuclease/helicase Cas3